MNVERMSDNFMSAVERERRRRGMSLNKFAAVLEVSRNSIIRCGRDKALPQVYTMARICEALKIGPNELLGWDESTHSFDA